MYNYFSPEFTYQKLERSKIIATTKKTKETQGRLKTFQEEDKKSETRGQTPKKGPPIIDDKISCHQQKQMYAKLHFSLSYKNKMAFFYLSANFLALVVSASSVKTSKGIFLPLQ